MDVNIEEREKQKALSETTSPITEVTKHGGSTKFDIMGNKRPSTPTYSEIYTRLTRVQVLTLRCEVIFQERRDRVTQQQQHQQQEQQRIDIRLSGTQNGLGSRRIKGVYSTDRREIRV